MGTAWIDAVKQTSRLTCRITPGTDSNWASAINWSISEFNTLSRQHNLGVAFAPAAGQAEPQVEISAANGSVSFSFDGTHTRTINGRALQGNTYLLSHGTGGIEKAFLILPLRPLINTPRGQRAAGLGILKMIALHELIHATGLNNNDHTNEDVFNGFPSADPGASPSQDRLQITVNGQYRFMPPTIFSSNTARKVQNLWS